MNNSTREQSSRWQRFVNAFKRSFIYKIVQFIISSAAVSLMITLVIFAVEQKEDEERTETLIGNLEDISGDLLEMQNSVSTRYLGIFPDYLSEVNNLLAERDPGSEIVIFEDVLYYGILSKPEDFIHMNHMLLSHVDGGGKATIVYYDPEGWTFSRMIRESRIAPEYFASIDEERRALGRRASDEEISLINEKYLSLTRDKDPKAFERNVNSYLAPLRTHSAYNDALGLELNALYQQLDSVKTRCLGGKPYSEVTFSDYMEMYRGMTHLLESEYSAHGVELIPIDEYLTMTCWLVSGQAVLAFPSKYATDEIGFYSKDPAFGKYINTMLEGVRGYYRNQ